MAATRFDFVNVVVANLDLVVTNAGHHVCRLQPRHPGLAWYCDLDDGTPTGENDPASFVRWVCPDLRLGHTAIGTAVPLIDVRRRGPQSDLGTMVMGFRRLAGRVARSAAEGDAEGPFVYTDPARILDAGLRGRIERWPAARHGDGVVRPAELWSIKITGEGLVVESASWWDSAPALDYQIKLATDIAGRLTAQR